MGFDVFQTIGVNRGVLLDPTPALPASGVPVRNQTETHCIIYFTGRTISDVSVAGTHLPAQGLPLVDSPNIPGGILQQATGLMPGVEVAIAAYAWFNTSTRTYWASFDLVFGAVALDTSIGLVIASGTHS